MSPAGPDDPTGPDGVLPGGAGGSALAGLRVLDLSTLYAAPQVAAMLGDHGADVVKVEPPAGDPLRRLGARRGGRSLPYAHATRNSRVVTLDPADADDGVSLAALTAAADVMVVNQPAALLERWGCGYAQVAARNPGCVYVAVSCFGSTGPYSSLPGNGSLAEAFAGLTHLTGDPDGPPVLSSAALGDSLVALTGVLGAVLACYARDVHGAPGQRVDVSMYEPVLALLGSTLVNWDSSGPAPSRSGSRVPGGVPRNVYRTSDARWVVLSGTTDAQVARVLAVIGSDTPAARARYGRGEDRLRVADELDSLVASWISARTQSEVLSAFRSARVPIAPVNDLSDVSADPHVLARGSLLSFDDPALGHVVAPGPVPSLSATPAARWSGSAPSSAAVSDILSSWTSPHPHP